MFMLSPSEARCQEATGTSSSLLSQERELELQKEQRRQEENDKLRQEFAQHANAFHQWIQETRCLPSGASQGTWCPFAAACQASRELVRDLVGGGLLGQGLSCLIGSKANVGSARFISPRVMLALAPSEVEQLPEAPSSWHPGSGRRVLMSCILFSLLHRPDCCSVWILPWLLDTWISIERISSTG